jgi:LmbE family N-acetylglucosaminyl deacetylase
MKMTFANERLLAIVAHPDDAELLCAGTLARAKEDGAEVAIALCCNGDRGQPEKPIANLGKVRKAEMNKAAKLLGGKAYHINIGDGKLMDDPATRAKVIEVLRKFKPTTVLAHDPGDYHPDHRAASQLAFAASWFCASRGHKTASKPLPQPPALWYMDTVDMHGFEPGFYIDVTEHLPLKLDMMRCHTSQLTRGEDLPALADLLERQARARGAQAGVEAAEAFRIAPIMKRVQAW